MTKLLEDAIEKARRLPVNRQDEAARVLLSVVEQDGPESPQLTEEQAAEVRRRLDNRDYATDEEVNAFFRHAGA